MLLHLPLHEEEVVSLVGRAHARTRFPDLAFSDPEAEQMLAKVEVDAERWDEGRLRAATIETIAVDEVVQRFVGRHPEALVISLYPGLCTRFSRVDNGVLRWVDLERPGVAEAKCRLYRTPERHMVATCRSLTCRCWMASLRLGRDIPVILVSQGALRRSGTRELDLFLLRASEHLHAGTELVLDHDARRPLRPSAGGSLEVRAAEAVARYPRFRFVAEREQAPSVAHLCVV